MDNNSSSASRFVFFGLGFLYFGWFAYLLAISDFFYRPAIIAVTALLLSGGVLALWKFLRKATKDIWAAVIVAVGLALFVGFVTEPTVYSGRDQGSIAEAAIELARNAALAFPSDSADAFFSIYGTGRALNFPGFFYTSDGELITQFPLGSIAWLGAFYLLSGLPGFAIGNGILLAGALLSIFFFIRLFAGSTYALLGLALASVSFLPSWFAKYTLSENLAFFLFSFLALNLALFIKEGWKIAYTNTLLAATLLAVSRIEGLAILPIALAFLFLSENGQTYIKESPFRRRTFPLLAIGITLLINLSVSLPFFRTVGKAVFENLTTIDDGAAASLLSQLGSLWSILFLYGLAPVFLFGLAGAAYLSSRKQRLPLIPVILALPTFLYLIFPNITPDHPWMLRRFLPVIFPSLLSVGVIGIAFLFHESTSETMRFPRMIRKRAALFSVFLVLFAASLPAFTRYIGFAENRGLAKTTRELADILGNRDLLLIDRDATGDPYAIPAGPLRFLYGKNAAYAFNPADIAKLPQEKFDHIYLLTPIENFSRWEPALRDNPVFSRSVTFSTKRLETLPLSVFRFPEVIAVSTDNILWKIK